MSTSALSAPAPQGLRFRFSLRTLLLATVLLSMIAAEFGGEWNRVRRQRAIVEQLNANGAPVRWDYQRVAETIDNAQPPPGSRWMQALLGEDAYAYVDTTYLHGVNEQTNATLQLLPHLPHLQGLIVGGPHVTDESLELIARNPRLTSLCIIDPKISAAGLAQLRGLQQLKQLQLSGDQIQDETLRGLSQLTQLEDLSINCASVTSAGLVHLRNLQQLRHLELQNTAVSDDGLQALQALPQLTRLDVGPNISSTAAGQLQQHLPHCAITGHSKVALTLFHLKAVR